MSEVFESIDLSSSNRWYRLLLFQATVTLSDVNDTPPRFSPSVYNVSYPEYQDNDPSVVRVGWSDPDTTGLVQLRLQGSGSDKFDIQTDGE